MISPPRQKHIDHCGPATDYANAVELRRRNMMIKLVLHNIAELTQYAIREGLNSV